MLERIRAGARRAGLTIRSTFIVGFPGETEADFQLLLDWLEEAQLDRVGCFRYEPVEGAAANALPERRARDGEGRTLAPLHAGAAGDQPPQAAGQGRPPPAGDHRRGRGRAGDRPHQADAPEIDGTVKVTGAERAQPGDIVTVEITAADDYDLAGRLVPAA